MKKYTRAESHDVLSPDQHKKVEDGLTRLGKSSAADLSEEEREEIFEDSLDNDE